MRTKPDSHYLPIEGLKRIAHSYHYTMEFNDRLGRWEVTHKTRNPLYFTEDELYDTRAICFVAMLDSNSKEVYDLEPQ